MTDVNESEFLFNPAKYFADSYRTFVSFGGPSVYFHAACLEACREEFLSKRHLEMLYATLTAWGMHRMGDPETTKTKLTDWPTFCSSILTQRSKLEGFKGCNMTRMSVSDYLAVLKKLKEVYMGLRLSVARATVVVNSKAFFHLFPDLVPPIDRQHTMRFFIQPPKKWLHKAGALRVIQVPHGVEEQFILFVNTCVAVKRLADRPELSRYLASERLEHGVVPPKALDNAIVNYVRIVRRELGDSRAP